MYIKIFSLAIGYLMLGALILGGFWLLEIKLPQLSDSKLYAIIKVFSMLGVLYLGGNFSERAKRMIKEAKENRGQ